MAERNEVYKCEVCGIITEVLHTGKGHLVCCGKPMILLKENTTDGALEKHVPVIEKTPDGIRVKVGSVAHPMIDTHYIEWIEILADNEIHRKYLNPNEVPEAEFKVDASNIIAREYCNLHGLWRAE